MSFTTRLTWRRAEAAADGSSSSQVPSGPSPAQSGFSFAGLRIGRGLPRPGVDAVDGQGPRAGVIAGEAQVDVWCEVMPPFHLMSRRALEGSCNAVLRGLVGSLLPLFVRQLDADYRRWAVDEEYRAHRAARGKPLAVPDAEGGAVGGGQDETQAS